MAFSWDDASKYSEVLDQYLPDTGEGDTMATQASTAFSKIGYRWFNDGDTIWTDECQSCADWLYQNIKGADTTIKSLNRQPFAGMPMIDDEEDRDAYGDGLKKLLDISLNIDLKGLNEEPAVGSVFDCEGPVLTAMEEYQLYEDDDSDDDYWDEDDEF